MLTVIETFPGAKPPLTPGQKGLRKALYIGIGVWVTLMFLFLAACIIIDWH